MKRSNFRTYLGIYLISTATLTYEIGLTRLFSVAQGYHFAFMVLSVALLGIGAGGSILTFFKKSEKIDINKFLSILAALLSLVFIVSFSAANMILFDPVKLAWSKIELLKILGQYLVLSIPFILSGMIIASAMRSMSEMVHRVYLFDMLGAGTGCILILYLLSIYGGEAAVLTASFLSISASYLFRSSITDKTRFFSVLQIAAVIILIMVTTMGRGIVEIRMSPYRDLSVALNFPEAKLLGRIFSPAGQVDIIDSPVVRTAPGISLVYERPLPKQIGFTLNGGGLTSVTDRKGDLSFLGRLPSSLAYKLRDKQRVFVVDAGGGMELLSAIENGANRVSGSESRGAIYNVMKKGLLKGYSGNIYEDLDIRKGLGRNVMKEEGDLYDVVQIPLTDTLGSSSGIRGLGEEYNLTVEAFVEYMAHLSEGGYLSISSYLLPPPRQELKLLSMAVAALEKEGINDPEKRVVAIRSWGVITILVKKGIISEPEIMITKAICRKDGFDLVWYPEMKRSEANQYNRFPEPLYHDYFRNILSADRREAFTNEYLFDISAAEDERPFFGRTFRLTKMKETYESVGKKWGVLMEGGYLLPWILIQSLIAAFILIMAPLFFMKRDKAPFGLLALTSTYFAATGVGFMFVEIALIQKLIPALGEPVYAVSAVLFSVLVSTGLGSYLSGRLQLIERYSVNTMAVLPVLILIYALVIKGALSGIIALDLVWRYVASFLLLFPLGLTMGIPFPSGMAILGKKREDLIPWAWCVNGSFSVISSVLAMIVAIVGGFTSVLLLAAGCYMLAWRALFGMKKSL